MQHIIFDIIEQYQLSNRRTLSEQVATFTPADWLNISDELDHWYSVHYPEALQSGEVTPLTFWTPSVSPAHLPSLSSQLLIGDRVFLDDPLYDAVTFLAGEPGQFSGKIESVAHARIDAEIRKLENLERSGQARILTNTTQQMIVAYIDFYLRAKDLINEDRLIPYKTVELPFGFSAFQSFAKLMLSDKRLQEIVGLRYPGIVKRTLWRLLKSPIELRYPQVMTEAYASITPMLVSLYIFALSGKTNGLSLDLLSEDVAYIFRRLLETATCVNAELPRNKKLRFPGNIGTQSINLPILCNIPLERILDVISEEPDAFIAFRSSLNQELLKISAAPGSHERERQIACVENTLKKDIANAKLAYASLKRDFSRKFKVNLLVGISSILVAALGTIGSNLDAISIATTVLGGAGITSSLKDIIEEWVDYQSEVSQLSANENYFLWRLVSRERQ